MSPIALTIEKWEAWAPGRATAHTWSAWARGLPERDDRAPGTEFIEPMLRRRLGPAARMALGVAHHCVGDRQGVPTVFASRHGELARTLGMLRNLALGEELSPTAFSLSVHNTSAGVFSIARNDPAPATAIAAGDETFGFALVEAVARLSAGLDRVLLVYADEPVPPEYRQYLDVAEEPHALALLLGHEGACRITMTATPAEGEAPEEMMSLSFLKLLAGEARQTTWPGGRLAWQWTRHDG